MKALVKRNIGKHGLKEKCKCRFVTKGFRQIKGLHRHPPPLRRLTWRQCFLPQAWSIGSSETSTWSRIISKPISTAGSTSNFLKNTAHLLIRSASREKLSMDYFSKDCPDIECLPTASKRRGSNSPTQINVCSGGSSTETLDGSLWGTLTIYYWRTN